MRVGEAIAVLTLVIFTVLWYIDYRADADCRSRGGDVVIRGECLKTTRVQ